MREKNIPLDKTTFSDLGIPFPLYDASVREATEYAGIATCDLRGNRGIYCFELGIGSDVIIPCPHCKAD